MSARWAYRTIWKRSDPIQRQVDEGIRATPVERRMHWHVELYRLAFDQDWAQADRVGPMTELERARFLLRRLYPDLEGERLDAIMTRLEAEWAAGTWAGFRRREDRQSITG